MPNIYIETYGCSSSQAEAEIMTGLLQKAGYTLVKDEKYADLVVLVTCYVKVPTENKILFRIKNFHSMSKKLVIAGCMPEGMYNKIRSIVPDAGLVSTHHIKSIAEAVEKTLQGKKMEFLGKSEEIKLCLPRIRRNPVIDIVPISSGCSSACSYCCVRFAKGKLFSYPHEMIAKEIEISLKEGCKEIWLTSQDNASYGLDKGVRLPQLLNEISKIHDKFFVRVGMMNLKNVIPIASDLVEAFRDEKIYKFVHLPVQSGSDKVLADMNRGYTGSQFENVVDSFKRLKCQVWSDVIVGYPTEKDEDFERTVDVIKRTKPDWVNVSKYGPRPGTEASKLKPLPFRTVNERSEIISSLIRSISLEKNKEWVGWNGEILVSEKGKRDGQWIGRNFAYKPVLVNSNENLLGRLLTVYVTEVTHSHLEGDIS